MRPLDRVAQTHNLCTACMCKKNRTYKRVYAKVDKSELFFFSTSTDLIWTTADFHWSMDTFSYRVHLVNLSVSWLARCWLQGFLILLYVRSTGSFLVKGVSAKNDANWAWLDSLADFLILVIFGIPLFTPTEEPGPRVFACEKEVTWSVHPGMPLLEFSGWLYSVCLYDLNTGIWGHPSDLFLTSSDPLSVGIWFHHSKRKITYALLLLLIHIW